MTDQCEEFGCDEPFWSTVVFPPPRGVMRFCLKHYCEIINHYLRIMR